jgi:hypothetical protein
VLDESLLGRHRAGGPSDAHPPTREELIEHTLRRPSRAVSLRVWKSYVRAERRLRYQPSDFDGHPRGPAIDEKLPSVVIVEGVRLLQADLADYFDLQVWIDVHRT